MRYHTLLLASAHTSLVQAAGYCPFLGPVFPAPTSLSTNTVFKSSIDKLQASIQEAFSTGSTGVHGPLDANDTHSIQIFSTKDDKLVLDFHRRGADVVGNRTVDGDSVYRIASTTKLITVYLLLLEVGSKIFAEKATKYLPELAGKGYWDDITVGALAGYTAGILADGYGVEAISNGGLAGAFPGAFPPLEPDEMSPCAYGQSGCSREIFLKHIATRRQVFLPNTGPAYSNAAFATLGLVLESATGLSYADAMQKLLNTPLNLKATTASTPSDSKTGVIVGDESSSQWNFTIDGTGIGMGALFSSANDMSTIGRAILSSKLLPGATTRAWLQATSHTSSLIGAVGHGWEIFRATLGPAEHNRVVDLYTKAGNFGAYGANLVLIPDFEVGFVVLMAGRRGRVPYGLSGMIVDQLLPALEEVARVEANAAFAGTYTASGGLNTTLVLSSAPGVPGLAIEKYISNGTDIVQSVFGSPSTVQMYPTNVKSEDGREHSWRSSFISIPDVGPFSACASWAAADRPTYGVYGVDEFVFKLDQSGKAIAVEPKALKIVLSRN